MAKHFKRFRILLFDLMRQGKSNRELAMAITLGILLGLFPIVGLTTLLCLAFAKIFKLNIPTLLAANYLVFPLQLFMIYACLKMGEWLFSFSEPMSFEAFEALMEAPMLTVFQTLGTKLLAALFSWCIVSVLLFIPLYRLAFGLLKKFRL